MGVYNQYNRDILQAAVDSILHQTFKDFEFIIYDDGSNKEAATILKEVAKSDPRIKLIGREVNHGLAFSLNSCIKEAKGKYSAVQKKYPDAYLVKIQNGESSPVR